MCSECMVVFSSSENKHGRRVAGGLLTRESKDVSLRLGLVVVSGLAKGTT